MRIAFITHYAALYGANRSLLNLVDGLMQLGVQPFVVLPYEGDIMLALHDRRIPSLVVPHQWWSSTFPPAEGVCGRAMRYFQWKRAVFQRLRGNLLALPRIIKQLKDWNIDVIYTNSSVIPVGALAAWWMGKPHVWHLREFGDLDYHLTPDWSKASTNFFLRKAAAQICISKAIRSHFAEGIVERTCHVVYNGVATEAEMDKLHQVAATRTDDNTSFVFALVGLIHPSKGQETAIRALGLLKESFPGARLIIAGGGEDIKPLKKIAADCGVLERVTFWGYAENPYEVYVQSDAVLMCSKNEALGRVTIEAMSAAKPVIGYNSGGTAELVVDGVNGLLYKGGERDLSSCMRSLIERPAWARDMGESGWKIAKANYTIENYAGEINSILSDLIMHKNYD
ncbi:MULTISPECIES: glycosyltransferase family 4 protein [Geobacter]|nr:MULTISPECIES: glycosyltransferase family 4 protein [Geobacter]MBE2887210.1 glycosyltransferase family 4 protein [Geobacter anodireducens]